MAVKYRCTKCGKRYVDWGAAKLNYKCTCTDAAELVIVTGAEERAARRPALRRAYRAASQDLAHAGVGANEEGISPDVDIEEDEEPIEEEVVVGAIARAPKEKIIVDEFGMEEAEVEEFVVSPDHEDEDELPDDEDIEDIQPGGVEHDKDFAEREEEWVE